MALKGESSTALTTAEYRPGTGTIVRDRPGVPTVAGKRLCAKRAIRLRTRKRLKQTLTHTLREAPVEDARV